jgi:hypothetical protein
MAVAKAKKKRQRVEEIEKLFDPKEQRRYERRLKERVAELEENAKVQDQYVKKILGANDESVHEIVEWIVERMAVMVGPPSIVFEGQRLNSVDGEVAALAKIQQSNFYFIAVRLLAGCAAWDIKIGNFKLPSKLCAKCGVKVRKGGK